MASFYNMFGTVPALPSMPSSQLTPHVPLYMAPGPAEGLISPGTIDLKALAPINNGDGTWSTVHSTSFTDEKPGSPTYGKEVLVRGILNGKRVNPDDPRILDQMKQEYYKTGNHLGVFKDGASADKYATRLHEDWQAGKIPGVKMNNP